MNTKRFFLVAVSLSVSLCFMMANRVVNVATSDELKTALTNIADGDDIVLTSADAVYIVQDDAANGGPSSQTVFALGGKSISITADVSLTVKPVVKGLSFTNITAIAGTSLSFKGIVFEACKRNAAANGNYTDHFVDFGASTATTYGDLIFEDCELRNYQQTLFKMNNGSFTKATGGTLLISGCVFANVNPQRASSVDAFINIDRAIFANATITNSTFYEIQGGIFRMGVNGNNTPSTVSINNCTFYKFAGSGSKGSGSNYVFDFSNLNNAGSVTVANCIFADAIATNSNAGCTHPLFRTASSQTYSVTLTDNNNMYNCSGLATNVLGGSQIKSISEATLSIDPEFENAENGNFKLETANTAVQSMGDPRWRKSTPTNIQQIFDGAKVSIDGSIITIENSKPLSCVIYNAVGVQIAKTAQSQCSFSAKMPNSGIYIIVLSDGKETKRLKIRSL